MSQLCPTCLGKREVFKYDDMGQYGPEDCPECKGTGVIIREQRDPILWRPILRKQKSE